MGSFKISWNGFSYDQPFLKVLWYEQYKIITNVFFTMYISKSVNPEPNFFCNFPGRLYSVLRKNGYKF